jgi:hypothetical protein
VAVGSTAPGGSAQPKSLWRHRDFMLLWVAQTISVFGSQFTFLALPLIAVTMLEATPSQMGLLSAFETAPFLLAFVWVWRSPVRTLERIPHPVE